jgi:hypothetical protein
LLGCLLWAFSDELDQTNPSQIFVAKTIFDTVYFVQFLAVVVVVAAAAATVVPYSDSPHVGFDPPYHPRPQWTTRDRWDQIRVSLDDVATHNFRSDEILGDKNMVSEQDSMTGNVSPGINQRYQRETTIACMIQNNWLQWCGHGWWPC